MTLSTQITAAHRSASSVFDVIPTRAALAAEVTGVDLRYLDDTTFGRLVDAWHQHSVLLVRGQSLSDQDLIAFSRRFGDLDWAPIQENGRRFVKSILSPTSKWTVKRLGASATVKQCGIPTCRT
jgi:taurine dioxygenase